MRQLLRTVFFLFLVASSAYAQTGTDVFSRARRLVNEGDAKAGRALVDSALAAAPAGSMAYAEALYWRGVLAEQADATHTDLLRVAIEFPLSARSSESLLRLAQLDFTRGDRASAQRYLDRLVRDHPDSPFRAAARYWTGRILLEDQKPAAACAAFRDAQLLAQSSDVEFINQVAYYSRPCAGIDAEARVRADSIAAADSARKPPPAAGKWSVQVASYSTREEALALAKRLSKRGFDARVTTQKPWRVRIGYFARRSDAAAVAKQLSSRSSKAMVVEAEGR